MRRRFRLVFCFFVAMMAHYSITGRSVIDFKLGPAVCNVNLLTRPDINLLSRTLGYLKGQQFSLDRIRQEFPELKDDVTKSELEFSISFRKASDRIAEQLKQIIGTDYPKFESQMTESIKSAMAGQEITKEQALKFLEEVRNRAKGKIESPVLETLLTFQFLENPVKEFEKGYVRTYSTSNHPKAKGLTINAKLPLSWKQEEGDRPNVIQKFISENGNGKEIIIFMVKDLELPKDYKISQEELDEFFAESDLPQMVPDGGQFISAKKIILDNQTGGQIVFQSTQGRLDMSIEMQSVYFITIFKGKMVFLQCMVSAESNKGLSDRFDLFLPLFRQIANSIILMDQY